MPLYEYEAEIQSEKRTGTIEADNKTDAKDKLVGLYQAEKIKVGSVVKNAESKEDKE